MDLGIKYKTDNSYMENIPADWHSESVKDASPVVLAKILDRNLDRAGVSKVFQPGTYI